MTVDITQIPYADLKENSIIVVRMPQGTQDDLKFINEFAQQLRGHIPPSVAFIVVRDSVIIEHFSEEFMNSAGWFRKETKS